MSSGNCSTAAILALALLCFGTGAAQPQDTADVWLRHTPAHPDLHEPIWVSVKVTGDVQRVDLDYDVYAVSASGDNVFPEETLEAENVVFGTCSYPKKTEVSWCFGTVEGLEENKLLRIRARAFDGNNEIVGAESYHFAVGPYPGSGPIPIRRSGPIDSRLDIVLLPEEKSLTDTSADRDTALRAFSDRLSSFVNDLYFSFEAYGGTRESPFRRLYNVHYSSSPSSHGSCSSSSLPNNFPILQKYFEATALLHCRSVGTGQGYTQKHGSCQQLGDYKCGGKPFMTAEIDYVKTVIHEFGHLVHELTDEYCGDTGYRTARHNPNIFVDEGECTRNAVELGYTAASCKLICRNSTTETDPFTKKWKIDQPFEPSSVMGDGMHNLHSRFFNVHLRRILTVYADCLDDDICHNKSNEPMFEVANDDRKNGLDPKTTTQSIEDYQREINKGLSAIGRDAPSGSRLEQPNFESSQQPTLQLELLFDESQAEVQISAYDSNEEINTPHPTPAPSNGPTLIVTGYDAQNDTLFRQRVVDPRWTEFEGIEWGYIDAGSAIVPLPEEPGLARVTVEGYHPQQSQADKADRGQQQVTTDTFESSEMTSASPLDDTLGLNTPDTASAAPLVFDVRDALNSACSHHPQASQCQ